MKILIFQDHLRSGGTERQSILLAKSFIAKGHQVCLLTCRPEGKLASTLLGTGIEHRSLQSTDVHLDWFAPGLIPAVSDIRPQVVLCMGRMANCLASFIQKAFPRLPVIATMRTGKSLPFLFRRSLKLCRHIVANSHHAKEILATRYCVPPEKITVIHNALVFPPRADETHASHETGAVSLLKVAMFRPEKGHRELIQICDELRHEVNWKLVMVGDGPALASCRHLVKEKKLESRIEFKGFVRNPGDLYGAADIAVLTSHSESLSNFLIEAQAHGLPCVAYAATGVGECFRPDESGYLIPMGDRVLFAEKLRTLIADPAKRKRFAAAAEIYAREAFDPARQAKIYLDLIARLVGN